MAMLQLINHLEKRRPLNKDQNEKKWSFLKLVLNLLMLTISMSCFSQIALNLETKEKKVVCNSKTFKNVKNLKKAIKDEWGKKGGSKNLQIVINKTRPDSHYAIRLLCKMYDKSYFFIGRPTSDIKKIIIAENGFKKQGSVLTLGVRAPILNSYPFYTDGLPVSFFSV